MTSSLNLGALNTGNYYGNGYTGSAGSTSAYSYGNREASSTNIKRVSGNIASGYASDFEIISSYMKRGETDKALALYESLFEEVKETATNYGYNLSDSQIETILSNGYAGVTGSSITGAIEKNTCGALMTGVLEGIPVIGLFMNGTSEQEGMAQLSGEKTSAKDKVKEYIGAAASGAAIGSIVSFPVGTIIGGAVGIGQAIIKDLF